MRQITACLASAFVLAAMASPARAADDMGSNPITELFDAFGMGDKEKPEIDYQERAPLVPPPSTAALPAPQEKGAVGRATGRWPTDPDQQRRAEREARANQVPTETNNFRMDRNSRLDPSEIGGRRTAGASVPDVASPTTSDNAVTRLSPDELSARRGTQTAAAAPAAGARSRLSDPPPGYMTGPAGAPVQPAPEQKPWYSRMFGN